MARRTKVGEQPVTATGVRVYIQSPVRRGYVASVIAPLARGVANQFGADQVHLSTGWRFGPHFDLWAHAHPGRPIDWDGVALALAEGARQHPAQASEASEEAYLRTATMLGQIEAVPPPYLPRRPHGHTELLSLDAGPGQLSTQRHVGLAHLMAPLTDAAATESDGALLARVAEAFLALADTHPHGARFGTFSFRSHAEAFFHWAGPMADYRSAFNTRMGNDRAVLEELVRRVRDGDQSAPARVWGNGFNACMRDFAGQVTNDDLDRATPTTGGPARRTEGRSAFHAAVAASGVIDEPPEWFAGYRLTINLFYQLLPALDVSPIQRFYLCHAVAESVDAVFGETWQTRLAAVETHFQTDLAGQR
jgi:hypothetical protein